MTKKPTPVKPELPPKIVAGDLKWSDSMNYNVADCGQIVFYKTNRFGWCIRTLYISRGKHGQPDRFYGISLDTKQLVTIGNGPHVTAEVYVYVSKERTEKLQEYIDLHKEGMSKAAEYRDAISTKRANTSMRRARAGSWMDFR